ncbi:MAG: hypothetical protein GW772_04730 [Flavobacteriia bacterium]|nr:hypothetical protein [Flavobacteriia bacterium]OIP47231.1 MAG: hypothetical protein AUK46_05820 [Flavobacteriaceae bacterium CG2_30_31_66]PIV96005.1 MAG: hypothetical protein COW43_10155 [Flavobacteriaceae bacterium CG17_big_fil_post_rev_8_21_14_2_50_31_13]PIX12199.1 MAG: hypothetical protein COZ74_12040 [Flavobacteriaceae bacterium CG_4_8_14_3_um_filter_31_8]PIY13916.1 MAG: hypothetical protein COZ16_11435 [Flavobacteriaceae bacterium CG_4_10_14_3_um_filter_31_253]PIZ10958.1 MAG: hypotheti
MKKYILLFSFLFLIQLSISQEKEIPQIRFQKGFGKMDFLPINMQNNEVDMGFTGMHYNIFLNDYWYTGLGIYGAVLGIRGGFFTLGVNSGIKKFITDDLYTDFGFHYGGGGGKSARDGGGVFIKPHINLGYQFKKFGINAGWSYINFFDGGEIKSHQLNMGVEIPLNFEYTDFKDSENEYNFEGLQNSGWNIPSKKTSLLLHFNNLKIGGSDQNENIKLLGRKTIRLAGFEFANYFSKNWFGFVKVDGAYNGIKAGYMDVFLGAGYHYSFNKNRTNILAKFGFGAGGGGGVDSKGGFLLYPDISIEQRIFNDIFIAINKGYVLSPDAHFYTSSFGIGLKYYLHRNGIISDEKTFSSGKFKGLEVITKHDIYFDAKRDGQPTEDLHQISLQINLNLTKNFYVAGQTSFALFGNAGAYAEGIVGLGIKSNPFLNKKTTVFVQALGGAAGGGDISTGQGLIIKPSTGFNYQLNNTLSLRTEAGYVKAKGGSLSSPFLNFGINYHISFLKMNH